MVYSLTNLPETTNRDYFIYLLDYGWNEPISEVLEKNFNKMATKSALNRAVIIKGLEAAHFSNNVFSWHQINGISGDEILPAVLITNKHPNYFREDRDGSKWNSEIYRESNNSDMKLILIPFKKFCKTPTEAIELMQKIFTDIEAKKEISEFSILSKTEGKGVLDSIILQPNIAGVGIDLKKLIKNFLKK